MNRAAPHSPARAGRPAGTRRATRLDAAVTADGLSVSVVLLGAGDGERWPVFAWRLRDEPPPAGDVVVCLGQRGDRGLYVDLARCPDVVTAPGSTGAGCRYAVWLARQLAAAGQETAVVGGDPGSFDNPFPPEVGHVGSVEELAALGAAVALCVDPDESHAAALSLLRGTLGTPIPVLLGSVPPGRWSLTLRASGRPAPDGRPGCPD